MATQEADASIMEASGLGRGRHPDDGLSVRFSLEPMENPEKSKQEGRPIYDDTEIIEIRVPGDPDIRRHPVEPGDRARFPRQYEAWKRNQDQSAVSGTPLSAWAPIRRSQAEEAKYFGLHTVEQLAGIPDQNLQRLGPGWITLRQMAQDWLQQAKDGALLIQLRAELKARDERLEALESMLKRQSEELHRNPATPTLSVVPPPSTDIETLKMQVATLLAKAATPIVPPVQAAPPVVRRRRRTKAEMQAAREAAKNGKE